MTRRLGRGDPQRGRARLALATVVLLTGGLLLGVSPGGSLTAVLAAVSGSPTSTTTSSANPADPGTPTPSAGSPIQLLNPSMYEDPVIVSNKSDADNEYHLVAWVGNLSAVTDPTVDFEVKTAGANPTSVFSAPGQKVGAGDTYETKWQVTQADGDYTVHATLFSGNTQVSTDSQAVTVRKSAETVEMTYPTTEGTLGVYNPPGANSPPGFVVDATTSETARDVTVFYGTAPPGTEQNWRRCSTQVTVSYSNGKDKRIGCTIATNVQASSITGVAAVAGGTVEFDPGPEPNCFPPDDPGPPPICNTTDSGDAHRVLGYEQFASALGISPSNATPVVNNCQELTATVLDAFSRPVWRAPIDVHATGPMDDLQFGRTTRTSAFQPPDQAGTHDANEPTANCGGTGTPPQQAEHNHPGGVADEKHIESVPATASGGGTDTSGGFIFAVRSGQPGVTTVEAWFDSEENDTKENEPSGTVNVTWLASTPSASRSVSGSPTASRSASSTASSTTSSSPSAQPAPRSVTLETSRGTVRFGRGVILSGLVDSSTSSCESGVTVRIERARVGADFETIGTATTASDGTYSFEVEPDSNAAYHAIVDATSSCQGAQSSDRPVLVRVRVNLSASDQKVNKGDKVRLRVTVAPCGNHDTTEVELLRSFGGRFKEIKRKGLDRRCKTTFDVRMKRTAAFKVRWPAQDNDHESGVSREVPVEVKRRR